MKTLHSIPVLCAIICSAASVHAGIFNRGCAGSCTPQCSESTCCPADYCCVGECKDETLKQECFESECKPVVIPPVKFPSGCCFSKLCRRGKNSCNSDGCGDSGCNGSCGGGSNSLISKLFGKFGKCKIRCVSTYKKKEFECGTKCVCSWKAVRKDGCDASGCGAVCGDGCSEGY